MNEDFTKKNSRRYETIDKIKEITERLEYGGMEGDYIDKIRAKLEILETITWWWLEAIGEILREMLYILVYNILSHLCCSKLKKHC